MHRVLVSEFAPQPAVQAAPSSALSIPYTNGRLHGEHNNVAVNGASGQHSAAISPSSSPASSASAASVPSPAAQPSWLSRLGSVFALSSSTRWLLSSLLFLWLTLDPHRRPHHLRTMLTFGPSALANELSHLFIPLVSVPALLALYRRITAASSAAQPLDWKLATAAGAHVASAFSLVVLTLRAVRSRSSYKWSLLHPLTLSAEARAAIEQPKDDSQTTPAPHTATLAPPLAVLSPLAHPPAAEPEAAPVPMTEGRLGQKQMEAEEAEIARIGSMSPFRLLQAMLPAPWLTQFVQGIRVDRGITFFVVESAGKQQKLQLDIYHPPASPLSASSSSPPSSPTSSSSPSARTASAVLFPLIIYVHGGGWITGDKSTSSLPLLLELARSGHVVATINYRLAPAARFPAQLIDCKRAIAFLKAHSSSYHADAALTILAGESAGGHLACLTALTAGQPQYQPGFEQADCSALAVVDLYGVHSFVRGKHAASNSRAQQEHDNFLGFLADYVMPEPFATHPQLYHAASPLSCLEDRLAALTGSDSGSSGGVDVSAPLPHFFCAHGTNDTLVPIEDTYRFFSFIMRIRQSERQQRERETAGQPQGEEQEYAGLDVCVAVDGGSHAFNVIPNIRCFALNDALSIWIRRVWKLERKSARLRTLKAQRTDNEDESSETGEEIERTRHNAPAALHSRL